MANGLAQLAAQKAPQAVAAIGALVFQLKHGSGKKNFDMHRYTKNGIFIDSNNVIFDIQLII